MELKGLITQEYEKALEDKRDDILEAMFSNIDEEDMKEIYPDLSFSAAQYALDHWLRHGEEMPVLREQSRAEVLSTHVEELLTGTNKVIDSMSDWITDDDLAVLFPDVDLEDEDEYIYALNEYGILLMVELARTVDTGE